MSNNNEINVQAVVIDDWTREPVEYLKQKLLGGASQAPKVAPTNSNTQQPKEQIMNVQTQESAAIKLTDLFDIPLGMKLAAIMANSLIVRLVGQYHSYTSQGGGGFVAMRIKDTQAKLVFDRGLARSVDMKQVVATGAAWQVLYLYDKGLKFREGKTFRDFWNGSASLEADRSLGVSDAELKQAWLDAKKEYKLFDGRSWAAELAGKFEMKKTYKEVVLIDGAAAKDGYVWDKELGCYTTPDEREEELTAAWLEQHAPRQFRQFFTTDLSVEEAEAVWQKSFFAKLTGQAEQMSNYFGDNNPTVVIKVYADHSETILGRAFKKDVNNKMAWVHAFGIVAQVCYLKAHGVNCTSVKAFFEGCPSLVEERKFVSEDYLRKAIGDGQFKKAIAYYLEDQVEALNKLAADKDGYKLAVLDSCGFEPIDASSVRERGGRFYTQLEWEEFLLDNDLPADFDGDPNDLCVQAELP